MPGAPLVRHWYAKRRVHNAAHSSVPTPGATGACAHAPCGLLSITRVLGLVMAIKHRLWKHSSRQQTRHVRRKGGGVVSNPRGTAWMHCRNVERFTPWWRQQRLVDRAHSGGATNGATERATIFRSADKLERSTRVVGARTHAQLSKSLRRRMEKGGDGKVGQT